MKGKIFNTQEVQAIIAGNKTMFREVIKAQPNSEINPVYLKECNSWQWATKESRRECPYQVGQKIFVKESFSKLLIHSRHHYYYPAHCIRECVDMDNGFHYWADGNPEFGDWESPRPATHMKQEQSRLTLLIKSVKVEKLQEISEEDIKLEGFKTDYKILPHGIFKKDAIKFFIENWNSTHKKPEKKFEANLFVWVVDFKINK